MTTILGVQKWKNNAALIADVWRLYGRDDAIVLDPTWGRGRWWTEIVPKNLICHDLYKLDGVDFCALPEADASVDIVAFDPPYVAKGGRLTSGMGEMDDRYGQRLCAATPDELQDDIDRGMTEAHRVLVDGGQLWVKCKDYVSSGKLFPGTFFVQCRALMVLGMEIVDRFEFVTSEGAQPPGRRQVHARRNSSTLFVFKK